MATKIINFFDGYTTGSTPTQIGVQNLVEYADDAAFEADNTGTPINGNIYYNTTDNKIRYYNGAWKELSDEDDISSLQTQITAVQDQANGNESNITNLTTNFNNFVNTKAQPDGLASLDSGGKVPAVQLPSYVDDVEEYADLASLPATGESGKIYITLDTGKQYRWSGSTYVEISPSDVNSVNGQTGIVVLDNTDIGLSNVTNDAQLKREAGDFNTFTEKTVPVVDDIVLIEDSEDTFNKKKVKLANMLGGGSGQGGINHLGDNGDADNGIGDWLANTGYGSTITVSSSGPLRGTDSFIVNDPNTAGASTFTVLAQCSFDIDPADVNKILYISFDFESLSSGFQENDLVVVIRRNDNSNRIPVKNDTVTGATPYRNSFLMSFQSESVTSYRIELVRQTDAATTTTMEFKFDYMVIAPKDITTSTGRTSWNARFNSAFTLSINEESLVSSITNPSTGVYRVYYNSTRFPSLPIITPSIYVSDATGVDTVRVEAFGTDGTGDYFEVRTQDAGVDTNLTANDEINLLITQAIQDQTAFIQSEALGTRDTYFRGGTPVVNTIAGAPIRFASQSDEIGLYSELTGIFEAKESGTYSLNGACLDSATTGKSVYLYVDRGSGYVQEDIIASKSGIVTIRFSAIFKLKAGDKFYLTSTASGINWQAGTENNLVIIKEASAQTKLETPILVERYTSDSGQTINTTLTDVVFENKDFATHGIYNTTTGIGTAIESGYYKIYAHVQTDLNTVQDVIELFLYKTGQVSELDRATKNYTLTTSSVDTLKGYDIVYLEVGETFKIVARSNTTNRNLRALATKNYLTIERVK